MALFPEHSELLWLRKNYRDKFRLLRPFQLLNHFPGESSLINKGNLTSTLKNFEPVSPDELLSIDQFYPETYRLFDPAERKYFLDSVPIVDDRKNIWIYKPGDQSRGRGIEIMWRFNNLKKKYRKWGDRPITDKKQQGIIQRYIQNPLLLEGRKSEIRVYWLVLNLNPLQVLVYPECTVRLNSLPFTLDDFDNQLIHVTNVYQQKNHPDYDPSVVLKWPFQTLGKYLHETLGYTDPNFIKEQLRPRIRQILATVTYAARDQLERGYPKLGDCFALFGADMILDDQLTPWLSEVQIGPGLSFDDPVKKEVIPPMLGEAARIVLEVRRRRTKSKPLDNLKSVKNYDWVINELQPELVNQPTENYFRGREGVSKDPAV